MNITGQNETLQYEDYSSERRDVPSKKGNNMEIENISSGIYMRSLGWAFLGRF
jgi:hypothetical protein